MTRLARKVSEWKLRWHHISLLDFGVAKLAKSFDRIANCRKSWRRSLRPYPKTKARQNRSADLLWRFLAVGDEAEVLLARHAIFPVALRGRDHFRPFEQFQGRNGERLGSVNDPFLPDRRADCRDVLPAVARALRRQAGGPQSASRNPPADIADIRRALARLGRDGAGVDRFVDRIRAGGQMVRQRRTRGRTMMGACE